MSFEEAIKLLIISFDATIKANLSVDLPLDLTTYEADSLKLGVERRFNRDDKYVRKTSTNWSNALKKSLNALPDFKFDET